MMAGLLCLRTIKEKLEVIPSWFWWRYPDHIARHTGCLSGQKAVTYMI